MSVYKQRSASLLSKGRSSTGWCLGEITRQNADGRRIVERGVPANFFVFYEVDEDESKHSLSLDEYG